MKKRSIVYTSLCTYLILSNFVPMIQVNAEIVESSESTVASFDSTKTTTEQNIESSAVTSDTLTSETDKTFDTTEMSRTDDVKAEEDNLTEEVDDYYEPSVGSRSDLTTEPSINSRMTRNTIDIVKAGENNRPAANFIDISSHNENISVNQFQMMKSYGVTGVVVKLTEGVTYFNSYAKSQIQNAKLAGMTVSVYHYSHYTSRAGAVSEATYFANKANELGLTKTTVMVSDIEEPSMNTANLNANTTAFKEKLNSLGYGSVAYYMSRSWLDIAGGNFKTNIFGKGNIWVAQYPFTPTASQKWNNDYSAWQWSSNFYFPGIAHPFDINTDYTGLFTGDSGWDNSIPVTGSTKITDKSGNESIFEATANIDAGGYSPAEVYFATWSEDGGQDDLIWYRAQRNENGTWSANINVTNHAKAGKYIVHTYAKMNRNTQIGVSSNTFNVTQPSMNVETTTYNKETNSFDVIVTPTTVSGVKNIRIPVWSQADRSDLIWYTATRQTNGTYKVKVNIKDHKYNTGNYTVHAYLYSNNGLVNGTVATPVEVSWSLTGKTTIKDTNGKETTYKATTTVNQGNYQGAMTVYVATWSGNDLKWYVASKNSDGTYNTTIDIKNHKNAGKYFADTYVKLSNGTMQCISSDTFNVTPPNMNVKTTTYNKETNSFDVIVTPTTVSGVKNIRIPVWSQADRSDLIWYTATRQTNGTYKVKVDIKDHKYNTGNYTVHVYLYSNNGLVNGTVATPVEVSWSLTGKTTIKDTNGKETTYKATTTVNQGNYQGAMTVYVATWSGNDLKWYVASKNSDGTYNTTIDIKNHKNAGKYFADTYVKLSNGTMQCISSDTFNVTPPNMNVKTTTYNKETNSFDVIVTPTTVSGVKNIRIPVWSQADRSDLIWYTATRQTNGTYKVKVDIKDHKYNTGNYTVHVYLYSNNGLVNGTVATPVEVK
ncbi:hypothetical protein IGJ55_000845 [Enterococcus sp. AZ170]|uniref:GBS Bsp-like repeat-containing protein n=1 Tax=Enterococcus sp. AZ170 TaxID=2774747 RepID=UPI003D2FE3B0